MKRTMITMAALAASTLALATCGSAESIGGNASAEGSKSGSTTLVVGSQDYLLERDHRRGLRPGPGRCGVRGGPTDADRSA